MDNIRCLIAEIPQKILSDIVERITEAHERIEVLNHVASREHLPDILNRQPVDVLILGMTDPGIPQYCREILQTHSNLLIIGLFDDGRLAAVYLNNVASWEIVKVICTFGGRDGRCH